MIIRRVWRFQRGNQKAQIRRKTDNTMVKRKRTKGQTMIYKTMSTQNFNDIFTSACWSRILIEVYHLVISDNVHVSNLMNSQVWCTTQDTKTKHVYNLPRVSLLLICVNEIALPVICCSISTLWIFLFHLTLINYNMLYKLW